MFLTKDSVNDGGQRKRYDGAAIVEEVEKPRTAIAYLETPFVAKGLGDDLTEY